VHLKEKLFIFAMILAIATLVTNNTSGIALGQEFNWVPLCAQVQFALYKQCNVLVNADGTLTSEGERAINCIKDGTVLFETGTDILHLPRDQILGALTLLGSLTECGNVVNFSHLTPAMLNDLLNLP
jgi:hypothetical protein